VEFSFVLYASSNTDRLLDFNGEPCHRQILARKVRFLGKRIFLYALVGVAEE
jgi:hypothetical protein